MRRMHSAAFSRSVRPIHLLHARRFTGDGIARACRVGHTAPSIRQHLSLSAVSRGQDMVVRDVRRYDVLEAFDEGVGDVVAQVPIAGAGRLVVLVHEGLEAAGVDFGVDGEVFIPT